MTSLQFVVMATSIAMIKCTVFLFSSGLLLFLLFLFCRSLETFWPTTGLFPQEFIISFSTLMSIGNIKISSANGKIPEYT